MGGVAFLEHVTNVVRLRAGFCVGCLNDHRLEGKDNLSDIEAGRRAHMLNMSVPAIVESEIGEHDVDHRMVVRGNGAAGIHVEHSLICALLTIDVQRTFCLRKNIFSGNCRELSSHEINCAFVEGAPISKIIVGIEEEVGFAIVRKISRDQALDILDEIFLDRIESDSIGFVQEIVVVVPLLFVVVVQVVVLIGGTNWQICDPFVEEASFLHILFPDSEEIAKMKVSSRMDTDGREILLYAQDRSDLVKKFDAICGA